jgi:hypothetical protein
MNEIPKAAPQRVTGAQRDQRDAPSISRGA